MFFGDCLRAISQCVFRLFIVDQPWWLIFLLSPPPDHKRAFYGP